MMTQRIVKKVVLIAASGDCRTHIKVRVAADDPKFRIVGCSYVDDETDVLVDWGDGCVESIFELTTTTHTYATPGEYEITISDVLTEITLSAVSGLRHDFGLKVIGFSSTAPHLTRLGTAAFAGCENLEGIVHLPRITEFGKATQASQMPFYNCPKLEEIRFAKQNEAAIKATAAYQFDATLGSNARVAFG